MCTNEMFMNTYYDIEDDCMFDSEVNNDIDLSRLSNVLLVALDKSIYKEWVFRYFGVCGYKQCSINEIAAENNRSYTTVQNHINKALRGLKKGHCITDEQTCHNGKLRVKIDNSLMIELYNNLD